MGTSQDKYPLSQASWAEAFLHQFRAQKKTSDLHASPLGDEAIFLTWCFNAQERVRVHEVQDAFLSILPCLVSLPSSGTEFCADEAKRPWIALRAMWDAVHWQTAPRPPATPPSLFGPRLPESKQDKGIEHLHRQLEELRLENERLRTRLAEERRTANRAIQRADQAASTVDKALAIVQERVAAGDSILRLFMQKNVGSLVLYETYEGVVRSEASDGIHVLFDVRDDLVEQVYDPKQFLSGKVPKVEDRLAVFVYVTRLDAVDQGARDERFESSAEDTPRRRAAIRGSHTF